jgi:hypothetical protein
MQQALAPNAASDSSDDDDDDGRQQQRQQKRQQQQSEDEEEQDDEDEEPLSQDVVTGRCGRRASLQVCAICCGYRDAVS